MTHTTDVLRELRDENNHLKEQSKVVHGELQRLRQSLRSLVKLQIKLDQITPQTNPYEIINSILTSALDALNSKDGSLMLLDEDTNELVFVHVLGDTQKRLTGYRLPAGEGIASWVVASRTPKLVSDVRAEPRFSPLVDQLTGFMTLSLICVPLMHNERTLGALEVVNTLSGEPFKQEDVDILQLVARLATLAIIKSEGAG